MANPKWPEGPYYVLGVDSGNPLTICSRSKIDDLCDIYSRDDSTVSTTREQAVAMAHLFAAAPDLYEALYGLMHGHDGAIETARAALSRARGETK